MSFKLGLTGGIGMGKSTTGAMFAARGVPVWDADAAVHRLYGPGGAAVAPVGALVPGAATADGIDRAALRGWLSEDPARLALLERIVHPLVAADRNRFLSVRADAPVVVLDIPLLFETGAERELDGVAVVSAPPEVQRARVLARPGMTEDQFQAILARQMPDAKKRSRATHIIETLDLNAASACVTALIAYIRKTHNA